MEITKRADETPLQYHKRLVYGKLVDKTLSDMDYTELSELVYGQAYSSDVARRMMYGSRRTLEMMDKERASEVGDKNVLSELDSKMIELRKERQKFYDQRREYNKLLTLSGRQEHLYEALLDSARDLVNTVGKLYEGYVPDIDISNNEAVLVLTDWHYGMTTDNVFT